MEDDDYAGEPEVRTPAVDLLIKRFQDQVTDREVFIRLMNRLRPVYDRMLPDGTFKFCPVAEISPSTVVAALNKAFGREDIEPLILSYEQVFKKPDWLPEDMLNDWIATALFRGFLGATDIGYQLIKECEKGRLNVSAQVSRAVTTSLGDWPYEFLDNEIVCSITRLTELYVQAATSDWTEIIVRVGGLIDLLGRGALAHEVHRLEPAKRNEGLPVRGIILAA